MKLIIIYYYPIIISITWIIFVDYQVIRIASRLWNATLVEDYAYGVNYVVIKSNAEIRLDPTLNIRQERHNDYFSVSSSINLDLYTIEICIWKKVETKAIPDVTLLPPREVSWWWLIIAVLLGLILLALLILILWKVWLVLTHFNCL